MKTTEKGRLSITTDRNNKQVVVFQPINNTIWMNRNELCELFGVYMQATNVAIDAIFKAKIFRVEDVCKCQRHVKGNRINYDITEVNLDVVVAMAFHLDSPNAMLLRKWFMEQLMRPKRIDFSLLNTTQNYSLN
ncbi:hypothetical protein EZS27_013891 [termite gut metagenome]|uniref:Bro-N domain-containing protein n=1 Tax=termite gut metagenome TaxID=433724 RepID=A0A5J4RVM1_9ZZZZ